MKRIPPFRNRRDVFYLVHKEPSANNENGIYIVKPKDNSYRAIWTVLYGIPIKLISTSDGYTKEEIDINIEKIENNIYSNKTNIEELSLKIETVFTELKRDKADKDVVDALQNGIIKQPSVETYSDLLIKYPNPKLGWDVLVKEENTRYNWNGTQWVDMETGIYDSQVATKDELELKANHGYQSNPKTLKEVEDSITNIVLDNLVINGDFSEGITGVKTTIPEDVSLSEEGGRLRVDILKKIEEGDVNRNLFRFPFEDGSFIEGDKYYCSFDIETSVAFKLEGIIDTTSIPVGVSRVSTIGRGGGLSNTRYKAFSRNAQSVLPIGSVIFIDNVVKVNLTSIFGKDIPSLDLIEGELNKYPNNYTNKITFEDRLIRNSTLGLYAKSGGSTKTLKEVEDSIAEITYDDIIACVDYNIVKRVGKRLLLSRTDGLTFTEELDVGHVGDIKFIHLFEDSSVIFADDYNLYYSHDWKTVNKSTIYNIDGEEFQPSSVDTFTKFRGNQFRQIVNGVEMFVWGNYSVAPGTANQNINVWYTIDKGVTVKSMHKFGTSPIVGSNDISSRHVHSVDFNPIDESFWIQTGDHGNEPKVIKAIYNTANDTWSINLIGEGMRYKWANMSFNDNVVYYSLDAPPASVQRCLVSDIGDASKHELIYQTPIDCVYVIANANDEILAFLTPWGGSYPANRIYYSNDAGATFTEIVVPFPEFIRSNVGRVRIIWNPSPSGKILGRLYNRNVPIIEGREPSIWINDVLKKAGFPDAFKI